MNSFDLLIGVASWEDRFVLGLSRILEERKPRRVLLFFYEEYESWSEAYRQRAKRLCKRNNIPCDFEKISFSEPAGSWKSIGDWISRRAQQGSSVLVDLSTMPRDTIWTVFFFCESLGVSTAYIYHRPASYNPEWVSRDPEKPRLVYKLSGIILVGEPTVLLVITGYDMDRSRQLFNFFQPKTSYLGLQAGSQYENELKNVHRHLKGMCDFVPFELDAYSADHGEGAIGAVLEPQREVNVVMSSLGPKPSAVALYRIQRKNPSFALCYQPSREFNREYSKGIGESIFGWL